MYVHVGETSQTLHERTTRHRSDIKLSKSTPVATHFNGACQPFHFSITALEQVKEGERDLSSDDILARLEKKEDILARRQREQFWIERLNTLSPHGLNKKSELQPPLPFIIPKTA
jgi:transposase InsO family protein